MAIVIRNPPMRYPAKFVDIGKSLLIQCIQSETLPVGDNLIYTKGDDIRNVLRIFIKPISEGYVMPLTGLCSLLVTFLISLLYDLIYSQCMESVTGSLFKRGRMVDSGGWRWEEVGSGGWRWV